MSVIALDEYRGLRASQPSERFGRWADWNPEDVAYLLEELRAGHYGDNLKTVRGAEVASGALQAASAANGVSPTAPWTENECKLVLNGIWLAATSLLAREDELPASGEISESLIAIASATQWTATPEGVPERGFLLDPGR